VQHRIRIGVDWDNAWHLDTGGSDRFDHGVIGVSAPLRARIVRNMRLTRELKLAEAATGWYRGNCRVHRPRPGR